MCCRLILEHTISGMMLICLRLLASLRTVAGSAEMIVIHQILATHLRRFVIQQPVPLRSKRIDSREFQPHPYRPLLMPMFPLLIRR